MGSVRAGFAPVPKRTGERAGPLFFLLFHSAFGFFFSLLLRICPLAMAFLPLLDMCGSRRIHDPISTSVNHAVVAELLHGARRERGFYGGLYGTRVAALVTGHVGLRHERHWTRKTVIRGAARDTLSALLFKIQSRQKHPMASV
jgi:hypothetical protein